MITFDAFFRFSGVGLMLLLATLTVRDLRNAVSAPYLLLACMSVTAVFLGFTPDALDLPAGPKLVVRFLDIPHLVLVWLFALSLFQPDFRMRPFHWLVALIYCTPIFLLRLAQFGWLAPLPFVLILIVDLFSVVLMLHLMWVTLRGRADDLNEKRRASRIYFVLVIGFVAITAAVSEVVFVDQWRPYLETAKVLTIWPAIVWTCYWLFSIELSSISFGTQRRSALPELQDAQEQALCDRLNQEMTINKAYMEPGLSIASMAQRLNSNPQRVRTVINKLLKFDNFSQFVNHYRIAAIKAALAEDENKNAPILAIAMEHGFNSLSPFNRAFRSIEGITPSEYRRLLAEKP